MIMLYGSIGIITAVGFGLVPRSNIGAGGIPPDPISLVIVEPVPGTDIADINDDYGTTTVDAVDGRDLYLLLVPPGFSEADLDALANDPRIEEVETDDDTLAPEAAGGDTQPIFFYVPPSAYGQQYAPGLIQLGPAHQYATGHGVVVAILDTGADADHELLAGRIDPGGYNFVDDNTDIADIPTGLDRDGDGLFDEMFGHGTFVAGVIAMVAPDASIMPVRVLDSEGFSDVFRVVQGIYYAIDRGVDVINLSLGTRSHNHILRNAVDDAVAAGIVVVAASGNDDREHPGQMPALEETTLGISSVDAEDVKSSFSNYGDYVSLSAPGNDVVSAMPGGQYAMASGTSISTAFVAGTAALLRSLVPLATPAEIAAHLLASGQNLDAQNPEYSGLLGAGRLDVAAALSHAGAPAPNPDIAGPGIVEMIGEIGEIGEDVTPPALPGLPGGPDSLPGVWDRTARIHADLWILLGEHQRP